MASYEQDPFKPVPLRYGNINQYQDPGLDDETRLAAMDAVRRAVFDCNRRTVWFLDKELTELEGMLRMYSTMAPGRWWSPDAIAKGKSVTEQKIEALTEEMLSRGPG